MERVHAKVTLPLAALPVDDDFVGLVLGLGVAVADVVVVGVGVGVGGVPSTIVRVPSAVPPVGVQTADMAKVGRAKVNPVTVTAAVGSLEVNVPDRSGMVNGCPTGGVPWATRSTSPFPLSEA